MFRINCVKLKFRFELSTNYLVLVFDARHALKLRQQRQRLRLLLHIPNTIRCIDEHLFIKANFMLTLRKFIFVLVSCKQIISNNLIIEVMKNKNAPGRNA